MRAIGLPALLGVAVLVALALADPRMAFADASATWRGEIDGVDAWVTVVARGHDLDLEGLRGRPWWEWGNTTTDAYLFAFGTPEDVRLILAFAEQPNGLPEARLYVQDLGRKPLEFSLEDGDLTVRSNGGHPYLTVRPEGGGWLVDGRVNYRLVLHVDGALQGFGPARAATDGVVDTVVRVGGDRPGVPTWMTMSLLHDPQPESGYWRFVARQRLEDAPPFRTAAPLMPGFPYLGIRNGYRGERWFVEHLPPLYFDLERSELYLQSFPGFHIGGMYEVNSITPPPHVDFESPFVFYNFDPTTRYAHLVVRADSFPSGDIYGPPPRSSPRTTFRYSWKTWDVTRWTYSLQVAGFHPYPQQVRVGDTWIWGVAADTLARWVTERPWPVVTFVEAVDGYPGSEGIYFYTAQGVAPWGWLSGRVAEPPRHLVEPYLPPDDLLTEPATLGLPPGFRGEYNVRRERQPVLYFSPIDGRLHLQHSQGGVWNLGDGWVLREHNLRGGPYVDGWTRERVPPQPSGNLPPRALPGTVEEALYAVDGLLVYTGPRRAELRRGDYEPSLFDLPPPTDKASWEAFRATLEPYRDRARDPFDLAAWIAAFDGARLAVEGGRISGVRALQDGVRFLLDLEPGFQVEGEDLAGIRGLAPGRYVVTYRQGFSVEPSTPPELTLSVVADQATNAPADEPRAIRVEVGNLGREDIVGATLVVEAVQGEWSFPLARRPVDVLAGQTARALVGWPTSVVGSWDLRVRLIDANGDVMMMEYRPMDAAASVAVDRPVSLLSTADGRRALAFLVLPFLPVLGGLVAWAAVARARRESHRHA